MSVNLDKTTIPISFYLAETCCSNFFNTSIKNEKTTSSIKKNIAILNAYASNSLLVITNIFVSTIQYIVYKFLSNTSALINMLTKGKIRLIEKFSISADMTANACIEGLKLHLQYTS
ncbi:MAG: hypothetical protein FJZ57_01475, partial [Chlamydiae bacterium]|nr:hypothetical protein [Chlamydiota bacterium]